MNRTTIVALLVVTVALLLAGGTVLAKNITCTGGKCVGTRKADNMQGKFDNDTIFCRRGNDRIVEDGGNDEIHHVYPRFRSMEISGVPWVRSTVEFSDRILALHHPETEEAPDEFHLYHDYFKRGFLMVDPKDSQQIADAFDLIERNYCPRTPLQD